MRDASKPSRTNAEDATRLARLRHPLTGIYAASDDPVGTDLGAKRYVLDMHSIIGMDHSDRMLMLFSCCSICLSKYGIAAAAVYSSSSAWRTSASVADPPRSNVKNRADF